MTDTLLLREKIESSGLRIGFIANKLGIERTTLWKKVNNERSFKQKEIMQMCELLRIDSLEEKERIFFATDVDKKWQHLKKEVFKWMN